MNKFKQGICFCWAIHFLMTCNFGPSQIPCRRTGCSTQRGELLLGLQSFALDCLQLGLQCRALAVMKETEAEMQAKADWQLRLHLLRS